VDHQRIAESPVNIRAGNELERCCCNSNLSGILLQAMQVAPTSDSNELTAGLKNAYHFPNASANFQVRPQ